MRRFRLPSEQSGPEIMCAESSLPVPIPRSYTQMETCILDLSLTRDSSAFCSTPERFTNGLNNTLVWCTPLLAHVRLCACPHLSCTLCAPACLRNSSTDSVPTWILYPHTPSPMHGRRSLRKMRFGSRREPRLVRGHFRFQLDNDLHPEILIQPGILLDVSSHDRGWQV